MSRVLTIELDAMKLEVARLQKLLAESTAAGAYQAGRAAGARIGALEAENVRLRGVLEGIAVPLKADHEKARELASLLGAPVVSAQQSVSMRRKAKHLRDGLDAIRTRLRNELLGASEKPAMHPAVKP